MYVLRWLNLASILKLLQSLNNAHRWLPSRLILQTFLSLKKAFPCNFCNYFCIVQSLISEAYHFWKPSETQEWISKFNRKKPKNTWLRPRSPYRRSKDRKRGSSQAQNTRNATSTKTMLNSLPSASAFIKVCALAPSWIRVQIKFLPLPSYKWQDVHFCLEWYSLFFNMLTKLALDKYI